MRAYWAPILALLVLNIGVNFAIGQGIQVRSAYYGPLNRVGIDVTRRVQRFADYGAGRPLGTVSEEITYGNREVMIRVQKTS